MKWKNEQENKMKKFVVIFTLLMGQVVGAQAFTDCDISLEYFAAIDCNRFASNVGTCPSINNFEVNLDAKYELFRELELKGYNIVEDYNSTLKVHVIAEAYIGYLTNKGSIIVNFFKNGVRQSQKVIEKTNYNPLSNSVVMDSKSEDPKALFERIPNCTLLTR